MFGELVLLIRERGPEILALRGESRTLEAVIRGLLKNVMRAISRKRGWELGFRGDLERINDGRAEEQQDASAKLENAEHEERIRGAIRSLPEELRTIAECLDGRDGETISRQELALRLGIPLRTLEWRLRKIRKILADLLGR